MLLLGSVAAVFAGCASPWKASFEPAVEPASFEPTERVVVRRVPWERLDETLREIERVRVESDVHPEDWTEARRAEEHAELVRALQIPADPDEVIILGRSVFRSTRDVSILDGGLSSFARSIGADYAIWSSTYLGKTTTVEQESVTRRGYTYRPFRHKSGHIDYDYIPFHETVYVPVVVERDEHAWVAYYARIVEE
jgi:hypothetical protein